MDINEKPIGLVLSGGAVLGMAHIGVLKVMEEIGLSADYISGTSAGALVGAFYAAGYPADEILAFFIKTPFFRYNHLSIRKPGMIDIASFIPAFEPYFPKNDFAALQRKLFITATDLLTPQKAVFSEGKLIERMLASSAVPFLFTPMAMDDGLFGDGAMVDNFPLPPLLPHCKKNIGVFLHPVLPIDKNQLKTRLSVIERAYQVSIALPYSRRFEKCDVFISPPLLTNYRTLDMLRIKEIYEIGYQAAKEMIPELEKLGIE